jgi:hypothetical protein
MAVSKSGEFDQFNKSTDQIFGFILCGRIDLRPETILDRATELWRSLPPSEAPNIIVSLNDGFLQPFHDAKNTFVISKHEATAIALSSDKLKGFGSLIQLLHNRANRGRTVAVARFEQYFSSENNRVNIAGVRTL